MKSIKLSILVAIFGLMILANSGFAQSQYVFENYNGSQVDRHLIYEVPDFNYCSGINEALLEFCQLGVKSAQRQAQDGLSSYGQLQGFFVGYSKGFRDGLKFTRLSSESVNLAKQRVNLADPKLQEKITEHINEAGLFGLHEGKKRFLQFIDTSLRRDGHETMPAQPSISLATDNETTRIEITPPEINLIPQISKRLLGIVAPTANDFLMAQNIFANERPGVSWKFEEGQVLKPTLSDLWLSGDESKVFPFDSKTWNNKEKAYKLFVDNLILANDPLINFNELGPRQLAAFKHGFIGSDLSATFSSGVNLQNNASRFGAYDLYSRYEFAKLFNSMVEKGYIDGMAEGRKLGLNLGALENLATQTDLTYARESTERYAKEFIDQYRNSFETEHRSHRINFLPVIEHVEIIGEFDEEENTENPIHQPNERFKLKLTISNAGFNSGKEVPMAISVVGEQITSLVDSEVIIKPLSRRVYETKDFVGKIGKVNFGKEIKVMVNLKTNTTESDADGYEVDLTIKNIVKIEEVKHQVYLSQGFLESDIILQNVSSNQAEDRDLKVELFIDGAEEVKASSDILTRTVDDQGKTQLSIKLLAFYLDPMRLLEGSYYYEIHLKRNRQLIQRLNVNLNVQDHSKITHAVDLLESVMLEEVYLHKNYANLASPIKKMLNDLTLWIFNYTRFEARGMDKSKNLYRSDYTDRTAITTLGRLEQLRAKVESTPRDFSRYFSRIACRLKPIQKSVRWGRGRRRFFGKLLKRINGGEKVKKCF